MSTDTNLFVNLVEEILEDTNQLAPGAKGIWKISNKVLRKSKIREILKDGEMELHEASTRLQEADVKTALKAFDEYYGLIKDHSDLQRDGSAYALILDGIGFFELKKKYAVRSKLMAWRNVVSDHKIEVYKTSDRALLGLNLLDGSLPDNHPANNAAVDSGSGQASATSVHAAVLRATNSEGDNLSILLCAADGPDLAETHPIFGNPWAGYERSPIDDNDEDSTSEVTVYVDASE